MAAGQGRVACNQGEGAKPWLLYRKHFNTPGFRFVIQ